MISKRIFPILTSLSVLVGCSTLPVETYKDNEPKLVLEEFFKGSLTAHGIVQDRSGKLLRSFSADLMGEWKDNQLVLTENFIYSDKKTQQRIWKIRKIENNKYQGEAGDIVGYAQGEQSGNALHWTYVMDLEVDGKHYHINFDDWMYLVTPKRLINRTSMSKFGFDVGEVTLTIEKN